MKHVSIENILAERIRYPLAQNMEGAAGRTGAWRTRRPALDEAKCNGCLLCWILCPDSVIDKDTRRIHYDYCKGCGICAKECPQQAIRMQKEGEHEAGA
jgi:pyruvate ferredoxin oxidoreductase delta subunit